MEIYTIGYSAFAIDDFVNTLKKYGIKCLIDVRSLPYSQYRPEYNKESLNNFLDKNKILYRNYVSQFGARQEDRDYYDNDGILDFKKFIDSEYFQDGIQKVKNGIEIGYSFALMCAEKDPINCHRAIMVGQGLKKAGFSVKHIKADKTIETQEELEKRLLDMYYTDRNQFSLFDEVLEDEPTLIEKSYCKRNKDIGYNINENKAEDHEI